MHYLVLKRTRVVLALLFFIAILFAFVDIYELVPEKVTSWIVYLQLIPSLLKFIQVLGVASLGFLVVLILTLLFGRIYCSSLCPLGIMQDIISFVRVHFGSKKKFYKAKKGYPVLRNVLLGLFIISILLGFPLIITLLDPYSMAGRFFTYLFKPLIVLTNNLVAIPIQEAGYYSLYKMEVLQVGWFLFFFHLVLLIVIGWMAFHRGRLFCNTICPAGTFLGWLSKISLFKVKINPSECTNCAKCVKVCKSECIDLKTHRIDYSRCVSCYNCLTVCQDNACHYQAHPTSKPHAVDQERRKLFASLMVMAASASFLSKVKAQEKRTDKGHLLKPEEKSHPVSPPGSIGIERFNRLCTGCGLCISACPTQVLKPAYQEYGLKGFMQPHMDYYHGQCNFDCTRCSEICPTGALLPLTLDQKHILQIGKVVFVRTNCVVYTNETACGACSEHCPTKAVHLVPYKGSLMIPQVDQSICIGCGACEHPCPLEPGYKAIYVNGNPIHEEAKKPEIKKSVALPEEDFPF